MRCLCLHCFRASSSRAQDYRDVVGIENLECVREYSGRAIARVAVPCGGAAYSHVVLLRAFIPYLADSRKPSLRLRFLA